MLGPERDLIHHCGSTYWILWNYLLHWKICFYNSFTIHIPINVIKPLLALRYFKKFYQKCLQKWLGWYMKGLICFSLKTNTCSIFRKKSETWKSASSCWQTFFGLIFIEKIKYDTEETMWASSLSQHKTAAYEGCLNEKVDTNPIYLVKRCHFF